MGAEEVGLLAELEGDNLVHRLVEVEDHVKKDVVRGDGVGREKLGLPGHTATCENTKFTLIQLRMAQLSS